MKKLLHFFNNSILRKQTDQIILLAKFRFDIGHMNDKRRRVDLEIIFGFESKFIFLGLVNFLILIDSLFNKTFVFFD